MPGQSGRLGAARPPARVWPPWLPAHARTPVKEPPAAQGPGKVMKLGRDLRCHNCRDVPGVAGGAWAERWKLSHSPSSATRDARPLMPSSSLTAARSEERRVGKEC